MHSTNYTGTFITASPDCPVAAGTVPPKPDSVAGLQYALLHDNPYKMTSDDLLFEVHARRKGIAEPDRAAARAEMFARPLACLRASPLVKSYGWGLHHDEHGRVALYGIESGDYRRFAAGGDATVRPGMRSKRG